MSNFGSLLFPLIIVLLFVPIFLNGRKQRRQMQEMQQLQHNLTEGDVVITTSGLRGTVLDASYEETIDLEIAPGIVTTWVRAAVQRKVEPTVEADASQETPVVDGRPTGQPPAITEGGATADRASS
jgi:preprotein translocase subunit YajC